MFESFEKYKWQVLCFLILISIILTKFVALYFGLYRTDIFCILQFCRDWVFGKPFYFDNMHGNHLKLHTHFSAPLFAVTAYPFGAYGLLVSLALAWLASFFVLCKFIYGSAQGQFILFFVFAGPLAYWIIDNQVYGFHLEQLFAPLALLFTIALIKKSAGFALILAAILCTLRQDGVVLTCILHLQYIAFEFINNKNGFKTFLKKTLAYGMIYIAFFLMCMTFLGMTSNDSIGGARVGYGFSKAALFFQTSYKELFVYFALLGFRVALFSAPFFILLAYFKNRKQLVATSLGFLVLVLMHFVAGARYIPNIEFSISWAPRFSSVFGFLCSAIILAYYYQQKSIAPKDLLSFLGTSSKTRNFIFIFACAYGMQFVAYTGAYTRFVFAPVMPRVEWQETTPAKIVDVLLEGDSQFSRTFHQMGGKFRAVAAGLPEFYPIALSNYLHTYFHRHDTIFLPARRFQSAWRMPRAVIVDNSEHSLDEIDEMQALLPDSRKFDINGFTLIVVPEDEVYFKKLINNPS